ncbi:conjugal transfer protein TraX [Paenibacillus sp. alder61]|uniref:TraX family protein n=1 Tax=Paenibacillus sp. alder61 TaxID=2862948 RepID=UPI001CD5D28F|nr:TraX family protein [Paenibacillus sp. alder61]MCA1291634.1 conjugal transfer protein TraX [Paenibacillus sp. alder61]
MQLIAMITMLIDHIGLLFFPGEVIWRVIGRIAFPLYAYALVQGYAHTSNFKRYATRLLLIAVISQIPYQLVLNDAGLNVVVTLLVAILVLKILDHTRPGVLSVLIISGFAVFMEVLPFDYGAYGLLLVLIFKYAQSTGMLLMHLLLNCVYLFSYGWTIQMISILPTLVIAYGPGLWKHLESMRVPAWVWRSFYPAHLFVLTLVVYVVRLGAGE